MKIQVKLEGDSFAFSGEVSQLTELINAAIQIVYGDLNLNYALVDSMQMPVTALRHLQTYTVVKCAAAGAKPADRRLKREGLFFNIQPKAYFEDEKGEAAPRTQVSQGALRALVQSTGLREEVVACLFSGTETLRVDGRHTSRREVCVGISGEFTWNFGDKCLGRAPVESVTVQGDCVLCEGRRFKVISEEELTAWRGIGQLDIEGFSYFLRGYEQCAIWRRWGDPSICPSK